MPCTWIHCLWIILHFVQRETKMSMILSMIYRIKAQLHVVAIKSGQLAINATHHNNQSMTMLMWSALVQWQSLSNDAWCELIFYNQLGSNDISTEHSIASDKVNTESMWVQVIRQNSVCMLGFFSTVSKSKATLALTTGISMVRMM